MCKLTENSYRDVNIAFANEISIICDRLDIDVWELIKLANRHPRVSILKPGPGVGGHCIAVDPWFIVSQHPKEAKLIKTAREVNDYKPHWVSNQVKEALSSFLKEHPKKAPREVTITCLGMTFKADVDDIRESPALRVIEEVASFHQGPLVVVEPHLKVVPNQLKEAIELKEGKGAILETDILVILVAHKVFHDIFSHIPAQCKVIDTQGVYLPKDI